MFEKTDEYKKFIKFIVNALDGEWAIKVAVKAKEISEDGLVMSLVSEWLDSDNDIERNMYWVAEHVAMFGVDSYFDGNIEQAARDFDGDGYADGHRDGLLRAIETIIESKYIGA